MCSLRIAKSPLLATTHTVFGQTLYRRDRIGAIVSVTSCSGTTSAAGHGKSKAAAALSSLQAISVRGIFPTVVATTDVTVLVVKAKTATSGVTGTVVLPHMEVAVACSSYTTTVKVHREW